MTIILGNFNAKHNKWWYVAKKQRLRSDTRQFDILTWNTANQNHNLARHKSCVYLIFY